MEALNPEIIHVYEKSTNYHGKLSHLYQNVPFIIL